MVALIAHLNAVFVSEFVRKEYCSLFAGIIRLHERILLTESLTRTMGLVGMVNNVHRWTTGAIVKRILLISRAFLAISSRAVRLAMLHNIGLPRFEPRSRAAPSVA